jgi:hypothetical protein
MLHFNKCDPPHIPLHAAPRIITKHSQGIYLLVYGIVRCAMHMPRIGEQVYVDELSAIFVVAWVDDETQTVDLVPSTGSAPREEYVPWQKLFPLLCLTPRKSHRDSRIDAINTATVRG